MGSKSTLIICQASFSDPENLAATSAVGSAGTRGEANVTHLAYKLHRHLPDSEWCGGERSEWGVRRAAFQSSSAIYMVHGVNEGISPHQALIQSPPK